MGATGGGLADSELGARVQACLLEFTTRIQQLGQVGNNPAALVDLCCDLKAALRDIIETGNVHDCMIGARLSDVVCPDPNDDQAGPKALAAIQQLLLIAIDLFKSCICSALLPPCGVGSPDDCIPLATLTVRTADLRVLDICNWSSRRFAVNFPMLGYWLGWLPIWDTLRNAIARSVLCADATKVPIGQQLQGQDHGRGVPAARRRVPRHGGRAAAAATGAGATGGPTGGEATVPASKATAVSQLASQYAQRATPLSGLEATMLGAFGLVADDDTPLASDLELQNPFAALALTRLAAPAFDPVVPSPITDVFAQLLRSDRPPGGTTTGPKPSTGAAPVVADVDRVTRLEESLEALQKKVTSQARTITNLRKQVGGK